RQGDDEFENGSRTRSRSRHLAVIGQRLDCPSERRNAVNKMKTKLWQIAMLCLMGLLGWMILPAPAQTQTPWPMSKQHPGIPEGYTIVEGDIQMPIGVINAMRLQRKPGEPAAPEADWGGRLWTNQIIPYQFQTVGAPTSTCTNAPNSGAVSAANQQI